MIRVCYKCGKNFYRASKQSQKFFFCPACLANHERKMIRCIGEVRKAIEYGILPALDGDIYCVDCGDTAECYDHRDYDKPIDVEPVCRGCNGLRGAGLNYFDENAKPFVNKSKKDRH